MEGEAMVGRKKRAKVNYIPDLYKGFHGLQKTLILKMKTAVSVETLETLQHSK
jgi:hypothetical protein